MSQEENAVRDLLTAYAHNLLEGEELRRAEALLREDANAAEELKAILGALDKTAAWSPPIPSERLDSLPMPRLARAQTRIAPPRRIWSLLKAAAVLALGFALGYGTRGPRTEPKIIAADSQVSPEPIGIAAPENLSTADDPSPRPLRSAEPPVNDFLTQGALAHLAMSIGSKLELASYIDSAPSLMGSLPAPDQWQVMLTQGIGIAFDALPAPPLQPERRPAL